MAKNNNLILIGLGALVAFFAFKKPDTTPKGGGNGNGNGNTGNGNTGSGNGNGGGGNTPTYNYPIFMDRYHPDAKLLQMAVGVTADGIIGKNTRLALSQYGINFNSLSQIPTRAALDLYISAINTQNNNTSGGGRGTSVFLDGVGCIC